jgi:hypothetical protein
MVVAGLASDRRLNLVAEVRYIAMGDFDEEPVVLTLGRQSGALPPSSRRAA